MIATVRAIVAAALAALVCLAATTAQAQGNSGSGKKPKPTGGHGGATVSPATSASAAAAPSASATGTLYYGSWLDDASIMVPGSAWIGASTAYWKATTGRQIDAPVLMAALGLSPRVQIGGSLPIYHFRDPNGLSANGVGTTSFYGKVMLLDPSAAGGLGVAVAPLVEIAPQSDQRFGWALPVNIEARAHRVRIYGSTGYFSRGSVFGTLAAEIPAGRRMTLTSNFGQSYASGFHQTDIGVGLAVSASPKTSVFVNLGHTLTSDPAAAGGISFGGGVAFTRSH
jgi:hypothetical protein